MRLWTILIILSWLGLYTLSTIQKYIPGELWFRPGNLVIANAAQGTCPRLEFSREISKPFKGTWLAVLQIQNDNGSWTFFDSFSGSSDYRPDATLPPNIDLAWWFWIEPSQCVWEPGIYRVVTVWTINLDNGLTKRVRVTSNSFSIHASSSNDE